MSDIEELDNKLESVCELLDSAAHKISDLNINAKDNITKIGKALTLIHEIQRAIHEVNEKNPNNKAQ